MHKKQTEQDFFNSAAKNWDQVRKLDEDKLNQLVRLVGFSQGERVLDIGSGTGVLLPFIKGIIGDGGSITAIDFAENMLKIAAEKNQQFTNISYIVGDIMELQPNCTFHKAICLNFFPHVADKVAFVRKVQEMLVAGGYLVIMHDISRRAVNEIHQNSNVVADDRLPTSEEVTELLTQAGYEVELTLDDEQRYFIKARKVS